MKCSKCGNPLSLPNVPPMPIDESGLVLCIHACYEGMELPEYKLCATCMLPIISKLCDDLLWLSKVIGE